MPTGLSERSLTAGERFCQYSYGLLLLSAVSDRTGRWLDQVDRRRFVAVVAGAIVLFQRSDRSTGVAAVFG
jgi:hypothetical protein